MSAVMQALGHKQRRYALYYLRECGTATVDELARHIAGETDENAGHVPTDPEEIRLQLHHSHLPKLSDALVVEYDERTNTVSYSEPPTPFEAFLDLALEIENVDHDA